jgi:UDP-N-acetylglucosamine 2-epimerase (non-hydrolysing)
MPVDVVHVTGARPNFPKAAPVHSALSQRGKSQALVHTGQHHGKLMADIFFTELGLPEPDLNLSVGSDTPVNQIAAIMTGIAGALERFQPRLMVVYGDVSSTLAAALVANKTGVRLVHVEAGLRSFDRSMPEEINRILTDQLADVLFATSEDAVENLRREGIADERIHLVGNTMIDTLLRNLERFDPGPLVERLGLAGRYVLATLHRPANVDSGDDVTAVADCIRGVADQVDVVLPIHPRGRERLAASGLFDHPRIRCLDPLGYLDFLSLVRGAAAVVTDSGGVQEETTVLGVPCFTLRPNTERPVTITHGTNRLATRDDLPSLVAAALAAEGTPSRPVPPLWDGKAGLRVAEVLESLL